MKQPIRVLVTGAAGQIAYSLLANVAKGDVFGYDQPVHLHLLDIQPMLGVLQGVVMELMDCAFPLLKDVVATADEKAAFSNIDAAFLVGSMPRKEGMERKDLLAANVKIFKNQGKALDSYAKKSVKVLVVGNPANTNALICSKYAPSIPKENFSALTRLDQNRATAQIAAKLNVGAVDVANVFIWGNHSSTQYPDASNAVVNMNGVLTRVQDALPEQYLQGEFIETVQKRGAAVISARKLSSAMSAAKAAADHMRDWFNSEDESRITSMAVYSDGSYGAPPDVMFSFPVTIGKDKNWKIHQGLEISDFAKGKLAITGQELLEEKAEALSVCSD